MKAKMASEDVIELGSSDEEPEPVSKKMKPMPNAMVHIPRGVTIKPAKSIAKTKPLPVSIPKQLSGIGKNVTITNVSKGNKVISNPFSIKRIAPLNTNQRNANCLIKKINPQVAVKKVPKLPYVTRVLNKPIGVKSPKTINNLPPSITVTRTSTTTGSIKRPILTVHPLHKRKKIKPPPVITDVMTVDDDDITTPSSSGPQWYLRPEDESVSSLEEANNKEPEKTDYIEITIEDSPVKPPPLNKRTCEVSSDLAVVIEDSPVKVVSEDKVDSDSNDSSKKLKDPNSKKKLEYPVGEKVLTETIEIEITPCTEEDIQNNKNVETICIEESSSNLATQETNASNEKILKQQETTSLEEQKNDDDLSDFHEVYRDFIKTCFKLENSDDMKKIVEKKIKTYYRQVPKEYTESEEFIDMVSSKISAMKAGPQKMYLYIKDIVDELNLQRKMAKSQILNNISNKNAESSNFLYGEESEYGSKRQRQIRKLEKTLKKLHRAIQKLETQEVDFDDDEDSVYLLTESDEDSTSPKDSDKQLEKDPKVLLKRYKERMVRVHAKFCQLTNTKMPSEPRLQIDTRPGRPSGPAKKLEKWLNRKVPIGTPLPFPDFHDVLRCVRESNDEDRLGWSEATIVDEARDLFVRCGKKLQRRRQENEWRLASSRIEAGATDPAQENEDLKKKLDENQILASKKETDVFNKFADKQSQLKLEGEEINDKEAEESPVESEEDVPNDDEMLLENEKKGTDNLSHKDKSKKSIEKNERESKTPTDNHAEVLDDVNGSQKRNENSKNQVPTSTCDDLVASEEITIDKKEANDQSSTGEVDKDDSDKPKELLVINDETEATTISKEKKSEDSKEKTDSVSDDSNNPKSDVDKLHLLESYKSKLFKHLHDRAENSTTSTMESSDSEAPIAISDTLESDCENIVQDSDVISIENSSYSESETKSDVSKPKNNEDKCGQEKEGEPLDDMECSTNAVIRTNNDEYADRLEDILLESSEDEDEQVQESVSGRDSVNLKDDTISIGETVVEEIDKTNNTTETHSSAKRGDGMTCITIENVVSIDEVAISVEDNTKDNELTEKNKDTDSVESVMAVDDSIDEVTIGVEDNTKDNKSKDTDSVESVMAVDDTMDEVTIGVEDNVIDNELTNENKDTVSVGSVMDVDDSIDEVNTSVKGNTKNNELTDKNEDTVSVKSVMIVETVDSNSPDDSNGNERDDEHAKKSFVNADRLLDDKESERVLDSTESKEDLNSAENLCQTSLDVTMKPMNIIEQVT